jgi:hypothetical protein
MSIRSTLFPPSNREAAAVAFLRTFWQVIRGTGFLGGSGLIVVSAANLIHVNLVLLAYSVGAVLASGILSGALAAGDILAHGLPDAYTNAATASIPATVASTDPTVTPGDPSQPAAGVPPAPTVPFADLIAPATTAATVPPATAPAAPVALTVTQ